MLKSHPRRCKLPRSFRAGLNARTPFLARFNGHDAKFRGMGFGYDANGRMVKATKANVPDALSVYDAAGMRVAERVNDVWRFAVPSR